jgi:hypothetical protein
LVSARRFSLSVQLCLEQRAFAPVNSEDDLGRRTAELQPQKATAFALVWVEHRRARTFSWLFGTTSPVARLTISSVPLKVG